MKISLTKILYTVLTSILLVFIGVLLGRLIFCAAENVKTHYSLIKPLVYDATTGQIIENASVTVVSDSCEYSTDSTGSTDWIPVYYNEGEELCLTALLVTSPGYKATMMYAVTEVGKDPLNGPLIYLFPGDSGKCVSIVYSPSDEYSQAVRNRLSK